MSLKRAGLAILFLSLLLLIAGCTSFQVGSEVMAGRFALQQGKPEKAIGHFERLAGLDPDYVTNWTEIDIGVWTYLGRAYYEAGNFHKALEALRRGRATHREDHVVRLYLGLVQIRMRQREQGLRELEGGLSDLRRWLDYVASYGVDAEFWDPGERLANALSDNLAMIEGGDFSWAELVSNSEWLGREFDVEIDEVHEEKFRFIESDDDGKTN